MVSPIIHAALFLVQVLFDLYISIVMLRFLLQLVRADFYNPVSQFLIKMTNPILVPLRRIIPGYAGLDIASILLIILLQMIKLSLLFALQSGQFPFLPGLSLWAFGEMIKLLLNIYFYAILISVILSWVSPNLHHPVVAILFRLTDPVLTRFQKIIPVIAGIDISPIIAIIAIKLTQILIGDPISITGALLTAGK